MHFPNTTKLRCNASHEKSAMNLTIVLIVLEVFDMLMYARNGSNYITLLFSIATIVSLGFLYNGIKKKNYAHMKQFIYVGMIYIGLSILGFIVIIFAIYIMHVARESNDLYDNEFLSYYMTGYDVAIFVILCLSTIEFIIFVYSYLIIGSYIEEFGKELDKIDEEIAQGRIMENAVNEKSQQNLTNTSVYPPSVPNNQPATTPVNPAAPTNSAPLYIINPGNQPMYPVYPGAPVNSAAPGAPVYYVMNPGAQGAQGAQGAPGAQLYPVLPGAQAYPVGSVSPVTPSVSVAPVSSAAPNASAAPVSPIIPPGTTNPNNTENQ